jgi:hypothetical protein
VVGIRKYDESIDFVACVRADIWRRPGWDGRSAVVVGTPLALDSKDVVKLTAGLIGTLTALVLGLLIASAKTTFDQKTNQVRQLTATVILLDDLLTQYGPEATSLRKLLRQSIPPMADRIWHEQANPTGKPARFESSVEAWAFYMSSNGYRRTTIRNVPCSLALLRLSRKRADATAVVYAGRQSIPTPFLVIMVFWLSAIFVSATLFARANMVVTISLFVCALSFAGAIFLVLELDDPFTGLMGISSSILRSALLPLNS